MTEYSHENCIKFKKNKVLLSFDCSGFVQFYFCQLCKERAFQEIKNFLYQTNGLSPLNIKRFYAADFVAFLKADTRRQFWQKVDPLNFQKGDLIVYASQNDQNRGRHCMLVDRILDQNENEIHLYVVDSTKHRHDDDTRSVGQKGIGRGKIVLYRGTDKVWNQFLWRRHIYIRDMIFARIKE